MGYVIFTLYLHFKIFQVGFLQGGQFPGIETAPWWCANVYRLCSAAYGRPLVSNKTSVAILSGLLWPTEVRGGESKSRDVMMYSKGQLNEGIGEEMPRRFMSLSY